MSPPPRPFTGPSARSRRALPLWSHPDRTHWIAVALITCAALTAVVSARQSASSAQHAWGTTVPVYRAVGTLAPGPVEPADI